MAIDLNFMIGGEAGQGVQSLGFLLAKSLARGGYHVFADQDYESRVRGGHNFFRIRASDHPVAAIKEEVDILVALNDESIALHQEEVTPEGAIIFDPDSSPARPGEGKRYVPVPMEKLAVEKAGNKIMANTVALGAALELVEYDLAVVKKVLEGFFSKKKKDVADQNMTAATAGYDYAASVFEGKLRRLKVLSPAPERMLLNGNEALSLGAVTAGCKFMSAYPMTPASSIMEFMAARSEELGLVMIHAEDEIAALNMAIGAAFAGARAMTATSGSGFCLMVEGLGMAGITETPVVIVDAQRPGPCVGLPTRTEQADLQFVIHAHHGEFPRLVFAPASVEDAFWSTIKAFNLADRFQVPAIILTDQHLASSYATVEPFDPGNIIIDRGDLYTGEGEGYRRHEITPSGISPRAFPGLGKALVVTDTDEHDQTGHLTESALDRSGQVEKRMRKQSGLEKELAGPVLEGPKSADISLIGWGSTFGAVSEASRMLSEKGFATNIIHFSELWPLPRDRALEALQKAGRAYIVENNTTGQLSRLLHSETGFKAHGHIRKYDGRPFTPAEIADRVEKEES